MPKKVRSWIRWRLGAYVSRLEEKLNGPSAGNPVHVEWMGREICWRLYGIKDAIGDALDNPSAYKSYQRRVYDVEDDHEHCDACWATICQADEGGWATAIYYSNEDKEEEAQAWFCPVCYSLFEAVCRGTLKIEITDPDALLPYQREQEHWNRSEQ